MIATSSEDILVDVRRVGRVYGTGTTRVVALHEVDLCIRAGARIALTGRSGSGKSTLLHLMAGLDAPTSGAITWPALGPVAGIRSSRVAIMMQSPSLIPWLTVAENVALPLQLGGLIGPDAAQRALRALEAFRLEDLAAKLPEEISGGQAQRVSLVRATIDQPALVLADEPTGQVDHATAGTLIETLFDWADRTDAAIVVATHDKAIADRFQTQIAMQQGRLAAHPERMAQ